MAWFGVVVMWKARDSLLLHFLCSCFVSWQFHFISNHKQKIKGANRSTICPTTIFGELEKKEENKINKAASYPNSGSPSLPFFEAQSLFWTYLDLFSTPPLLAHILSLPLLCVPSNPKKWPPHYLFFSFLPLLFERRPRRGWWPMLSHIFGIFSSFLGSGPKGDEVL